MSRTKADIINNAFSQLRISGVTVDPTPEENSLALDRLETLMSEFSGRNICLGYNFEDTPDAATDHNIKRKYWQAIETILAARLIPDFGKQIMPELLMQANSGLSFISSDTARIPTIDHSPRMPTGSGNTIKRAYAFERFYESEETAPTSCITKKMIVGDIENFQESFESWLDSSTGETLDSYTIAASDGLTIVSDSQSGNVVSYQISAQGGEGVPVYKVKIVGTSTTGRAITRLIYFELTEVTV